VSPLRGEKPQNWPLSKLNTGRFALRAMLPVKNKKTICSEAHMEGTYSTKSRWAAQMCGSKA